MILLGLKNTSTQTVPVDGLIDFGAVYRKYTARNLSCNCINTTSSTAPVISYRGIYHVYITITFTATAAGDVTLQLLENGEAVAGASATQTVSTASTELNTVSFDYFILVNSSNVLGYIQTAAKAISVQSGSEITVTNAILNIKKEV